jgi:hypothetical protein
MDEVVPLNTAPESAGAPFLLAMLAVVIAGAAWFTYGAGLEHAFVGWGFLLAIPFALGALATGIGALPFNVVGCLGAPILLFAIILAIVNLGFAEGLICIAMVLPFWVVAGVGGGLAALIIRKRRAVFEAQGGARVQVAAFLTLPFALIYAEEVTPAQWETRSVESAVIIDADPAEVWPLLLSIPDISAQEGISTFTHDVIGLARPSEATLETRGTSQVRVGQWGPNITFEEHVTQRIEGQRVAWRFVFPDDSVQIHTDKHIDPDGPILKVARGSYNLERLDNGATKVTLKTQYRMRTRLGWYFGLWGEVMLGDVHDNVLAIIKKRAESR